MNAVDDSEWELWFWLASAACIIAILCSPRKSKRQHELLTTVQTFQGGYPT